uniref:Nuclear receptor n=1 Tax=Panagrellus redivivus TaxID=6233 RepID=A0A7E4ZRW2_PANRE
MFSNRSGKESFAEHPNLPIIRKMPPNICFVCGDPTKCYHYDVPSCTGCKTFFRRTIISGKVYACKNNGKCDMKAKDNCRKCRFDQCIFAGMNLAAMILPENIDLTKIIERIKATKTTMETTGLTNMPISSSAPSKNVSIPLKMDSLKFLQPMEFRDIDFLLFVELKLCQLRESTYHPDFTSQSTVQSIIESRTELGNVNRYVSLRNFRLTHQDFLKDMYTMAHALKPHNPHRKHWLAIDIFLNMEVAKTLSVFEMLTYADKKAFVLNASLSTAMLTKAYYSYERKSDAVIYPDGFVGLWLAMHDHNELNSIENDVYVRSIHPIRRINMTKEEYVLVKAIMLCNPACRNISEAGRNILEQEFQRYSKILLKYLQSIHGAAKGASRYAQVIAITVAMAYFAEQSKRLHAITMMTRDDEHHKPPYIHRVISSIMES